MPLTFLKIRKSTDGQQADNFCGHVIEREEPFLYQDKLPWEPAGENVRRQVMGWNSGTNRPSFPLCRSVLGDDHEIGRRHCDGFDARNDGLPARPSGDRIRCRAAELALVVRSGRSDRSAHRGICTNSISGYRTAEKMR